MDATLSAVIGRLERVKRSGSEWTARCPAHEDKDPSLSIGQGQDGRVLLHCHAGCDTEAVIRAIGLEWSDLSPEPSTNGQRDEIVATFDYVDEDGELLYQAVRRFPKKFLQRRPDGFGGWEWKSGKRKVLYRLPEVVEAVAQDRPVYIVEGEKDADRLRAEGLCATTNVGGAEKWRSEYTETLRGARVIILPDNDPPGRAHAETVRQALEGVAEEVRVVELPGLPEKGDVSDWLDAGRTVEELVDVVANGDGDAEDSPVFVTLAELLGRPELLEPPPVVVPRIAYRGRATGIAGPDKSGKSTLLAHAAARLSRRDRFLGEPMGIRHGTVLWVGLEEAIGDAVRRFRDLGAVGDRIRMVVAPRDDLLARIGEELEAEPADLVVIDSLTEYARVTEGEPPDDGDSAGWSTVIRPIIALAARKHDAAVVFLHHVRRSDGEYRGSGEIAAAVDLLLELRMPEKGQDPNLRRISGRGRWGTVSYSVALRDDKYELAAGTDLSRDALVLIHVEQNPGCSLRSVRGAVRGKSKAIANTVQELIARGAIENHGEPGDYALYPVGAQTEMGAT